MKRIVSTTILAVLLAVAVAATHAAALPDEIILQVEIPSFVKLNQDMQLFGNAAGVPAGMLSQGMLMGTPLKVVKPMVMDHSKPIRALVLASADNPAVVLMCGLIRRNDVLALSDKLVSKGEVDGITRLEEKRQEFDMEAFNKAPMDRRKNFDQFMKTKAIPTAFGQVGGFALISRNAEALKTVLALAQKGRWDLQSTVRPDATVSVLARPAPAIERLKASGQDPFARIRAQAEKMPMPPGAATDINKAAISMYLDAFEALAGQADEIVASVSLGAEGISIQVEGTVQEDGSIARYLASVPAGDLRTLKYLAPDGLLVMASKMGDMKPFLQWYAKLLDDIMKASGADEATLAKMRDNMLAMGDLYGDEFGFAVKSVPGGGISIVQVVAVKDPAALKETMSKAIVAWGQTMGMGKLGMKMDITYEPDVLQVAGHAVTRMTWTFDFKALAEGADVPPEMMAQQQKAMDALFGSPMTGYMTFFGNDMVFTMGKTALADLQALCKGLPQTSAATRVQGAPAGAAAVTWYSLTESIAFALSFARNIMPPGQLPATLQVQPGPGVSSWLQVDGNRPSLTCRIPIQEIQALVQTAQQAQRAMMRKQADGLTETAPMPKQ